MFDASVLSYRVKGYYRGLASSPGAETIIYSGFTTQLDAHRLKDKMLSSCIADEAHVEVHMQGQGWVPEPQPTADQREAAIAALEELKTAILRS